MVGHSKWSKLNRGSGLLDARRGPAFGKPIMEITAAVRLGGDEPSSRSRPRPAVKLDFPKAISVWPFV